MNSESRSSPDRLPTSLDLANRINEMVQRRNRELAFDAALKASLGIVFSLVTFGVLFWMGWFVGFFVARKFGLHPYQFGLILSGIFLVVATWSAWQRVNPLAGLSRLTDAQLLLTFLSQASSEVLYFSPRHATAGAAMILLGGPANVFEAIGIWAHRIRANASSIEDASRLLESCERELPVEQVDSPRAALLLKRLALVSLVPKGESRALVLTEKGSRLVSKGKKRRHKPKSSDAMS